MFQTSNIYKYLLLSLCFLLVPFSIWAWQSDQYLFPLILAVVLLTSISVRPIDSKTIKVLCYLSLGLVGYWVVGNIFFVPEGNEIKLFSFIPFLSLAVVNAIAVLITYGDGYMYGAVFTAASIISLFFSKGPLDFSSIDRFIVSVVLFALSSFIFVYYISKIKKVDEGIYSILKASIVAAVLLSLIFTLKVFGVDMLISGHFNEFANKAAQIFISVAWLSIVSNGFIVSLLLLAHEVVLYSLELRRDMVGEEAKYYKYKKEALTEEDLGEEGDPYEPLILSLKKFMQDINNYDKDSAQDAIKRFDSQFTSLSLIYDTKSKEKAKSLLGAVKKLSKEIKVEMPREPQLLPPVTKEEMIELPKGSTLLVEGPIGSRKEEFCLKFLKAEIEKGNLAMICSYEPEKEAGWFSNKDRKKLELLRVEPNITEMALSITKALEKRPTIIFFNVLFHLLPVYSTDVLSDFLSSTFKKLKNFGCTVVFVTEKEVLTQTLPMIESLFDGIIEFQIREEDEELTSYYRIKEFKFKKFDTNWKKLR